VPAPFSSSLLKKKDTMFRLLFLVLILTSSLSAQESCPTELEKALLELDKAKRGIFSAEFEIWQEGSGARNRFLDHKTAEEHYEAAAVGNEICFGLLSAIQNVTPPPSSICTGRWGGGNLYRPISNRGAPVVVLKQSYCFEDRSITADMKPLNIWITDTSGNLLDGGTFRYCNLANEGRLHHDFPRSAGIQGPIQIRVVYEDDSFECFDVPDATKEYK